MYDEPAIREIPEQVVERLLCQAIVIARELSYGHPAEDYILEKLNRFPALDSKHLAIFERIAKIFEEEIGLKLSYWAK